ncbi:flagellar basal body P-ring formation chaperone FlgA [Pseudogulbenkiania sp. NH8B]|uniref:flagellar basal body P-ring formation chaperone FlgA n=1 Tax=Pseudogulbenkiania sp. (strain NH8B) TaxID=748280 RepID=UPI000688C88D|nr:flagellar basal body P-ring formation chaperone FlgA [Pseudogulbenkiania sp. NH8B]
MAIFTALRPTPLLLTLLTLSLPAAADASPAARELDRAVLTHARRWLDDAAARVGLEQARPRLTPIPPREAAALPACRQPLEVEAFDTASLSRLRFAVRCPEPQGWSTVYTVRAELEARQLVATRDLDAGKVLGADDVEWAQRPVYELEEGLHSPAEAVGLSSRSALRRGQPLRRKLLEAAVLVRRGEAVEIVASKEGIVVTAPGESLESGRRNDVIRVRNVGSGKILRARVAEAGRVVPE